MSTCAVCGNEKILCVCPKALGGAGESKGASRDEALDHAVTQIANALLNQYAYILRHHPEKIHQFIKNLRALLDSESATPLLELLEEGAVTSTERTTFIEQFKNLSPNMAMLDALSHQFALNLFPSPANQLVTGIQQELKGLEGWPPYPDIDGGNFQQALASYATYYQTLPHKKQAILSDIFWVQIKNIGTPVIESNQGNPAKCSVYFLMRKDKKILNSKEVPGTTKDLYLQGDFHGYDTTEGRQRVLEFNDTGIMLLRNTIPRNAVITYRYIQLEPSLRGKTPTEHYGSAIIEEPPATFFPPDESDAPRVIAPQTEDASKKFWGRGSQLADPYSLHREPVIGFSGTERIFRINPDPAQAKLPAKQINWSTLFAPSGPDSPNSHFKYHSTLYSTLDGQLHFADPLYRQPNAGPQLLFSADKNSSYADCTRSVHVFMPTSEKVDRVIIVNDGMQYLGSDAISTFEHMAEKGELSENTAFIFITPLPALLKTIPADDPKSSMPGNGERVVDYEHRIEDYVNFIANSLLPTLKKEGLDLPDAPIDRVMIGASMSGTASLYIGSKHPELVGGAIAQSPSPSNRSILRDLVATYDPAAPRAEIYLSCGDFERPGCADNTNLPYAEEISEKLNIPLHRSAHGHQFIPWIHELEQSVPEVIGALNSYKMTAVNGQNTL